MTSAVLGRFYTTKPWSHHKEIHNKIGKLHKIGGWGLVVFGFVTTTIGLIVYEAKHAA